MVYKEHRSTWKIFHEVYYSGLSVKYSNRQFLHDFLRSRLRADGSTWGIGAATFLKFGNSISQSLTGFMIWLWWPYEMWQWRLALNHPMSTETGTNACVKVKMRKNDAQITLSPGLAVIWECRNRPSGVYGFQETNLRHVCRLMKLSFIQFVLNFWCFHQRRLNKTLELERPKLLIYWLKKSLRIKVPGLIKFVHSNSRGNKVDLYAELHKCNIFCVVSPKKREKTSVLLSALGNVWVNLYFF